MDSDLTQKIMQRLAELPDDVRRAVQSADMGKKIEAIGVKYNLHVDQIGELEDEALMVMLGFSAPESFEKRITESLHLSTEVAKQVVADIDRDVFLAVRASLRKFTEESAQQKEIHPAEAVLSQKTVTIAPPTPPKPEPYKADPYREPVDEK